jgi:hypothetical protein
LIYDPNMARDIDVGGLFDKLIKGGVRKPASQPAPSHRRRAATKTSTSRGRVRDVLRKGTTTAKRVATKAKSSRFRGRRTSLPPEGVVTVEYSPRIDGDPDPGEVVWTWVPYEEDPEQGKDRPVVVIGRRGRSLVGVPLTTKPNDREAQISIGSGDWDPKRRQSWARVWRMLDIDPDRTRREGAILSKARWNQVVAAVDQYYEIRHAPTGKSVRSDDADYDY